MPIAKLVRFDRVDHQERRPSVILTSVVYGSSGATQISSGVAEFAAGASAPTHNHDAAFISPGAHQGIANQGDRPFEIKLDLCQYQLVYDTGGLIRSLIQPADVIKSN